MRARVLKPYISVEILDEGQASPTASDFIWSGTDESENEFSVKLSPFEEHHNCVFSLSIVLLSRQCVVKSQLREGL